MGATAAYFPRTPQQLHPAMPGASSVNNDFTICRFTSFIRYTSPVGDKLDKLCSESITTTSQHWPPPAGRRCSCSSSSWRWMRRWSGSSSPPEPPGRTHTPTHTLAWCCSTRDDTGPDRDSLRKSPALEDQIHTIDPRTQDATQSNNKIINN